MDEPLHGEYSHGYEARLGNSLGLQVTERKLPQLHLLCLDIKIVLGNFLKPLAQSFVIISLTSGYVAQRILRLRKVPQTAGLVSDVSVSCVYFVAY